MTTTVRIPAYRLHDPALRFSFPWVISASGGQWLDALVHQAPWNRCKVEQRYFPTIRAVHDANREVPGLERLTTEAWYQAYVKGGRDCQFTGAFDPGEYRKIITPPRIASVIRL